MQKQETASQFSVRVRRRPVQGSSIGAYLIPMVVDIPEHVEEQKDACNLHAE